MTLQDGRRPDRCRRLRGLVARRRRLPPWCSASALAALISAIVAASPAAAADTGSLPWDWPVDPVVVVHEFDPPDVPWGSGHRGVDLAASVGQSIHAPAPGSVSYAGVIAGRGVVVVSHGAVRTTYEPVDAAVTVGTSVEAGDLLGALQPFAHHCSSPCLHWGALRGDEYLDPTAFIDPGPSRLLPVWTDGQLSQADDGREPVGAALEDGAAAGGWPSSGAADAADGGADVDADLSATDQPVGGPLGIGAEPSSLWSSAVGPDDDTRGTTNVGQRPGPARPSAIDAGRAGDPARGSAGTIDLLPVGALTVLLGAALLGGVMAKR